MAKKKKKKREKKLEVGEMWGSDFNKNAGGGKEANENWESVGWRANWDLGVWSGAINNGL
jgi:hypothetical protein